MDWFTKHADAITIITAIVLSMLWMSGKFNDVDRRFSEVEKEIAIIKTVMILKQIIPAELAKSEGEK